MARFKVNFTDNIQLTFNLIDEEIVDIWKTLIVQHNPADVSMANHRIGYANLEQIQNRIERLYELADYINTHTPERVIKSDINEQTWKTGLHTMHVHFPDLRNDETYQEVWPLLTEYNDIIHWLESILNSVWGNEVKQYSQYRLNLDVNKANAKFFPIPEDAYKLFKPFNGFGLLALHYTHVGKHSQEIFNTKDFTCPKEQFVPQRTFGASVRLYFTDNFYDEQSAKDKYYREWKEFYEAKGGKEFWGHDIDDPKLAFGYMMIGNMSEIMMDGVQVNIPKTDDELRTFRTRLIEADVLSWSIE